jgi:uncharacterized protein YjbJ (UPF0337 family)
MNWHQIAGNWRQCKGQVRERWGKLTEDDLEVIRGKREQLVGKIQERYGLSIKVVERQIHEFFSALKIGDHEQEKQGAHHSQNPS